MCGTVRNARNDIWVFDDLGVCFLIVTGLIFDIEIGRQILSHGDITEDIKRTTVLGTGYFSDITIFI